MVHTFAFVRWFKNIGNTGQTFSDAGLEFWNEDFEDLDELAILPVQRIYDHVAIVKYKSFSSRARTNKTLVFPLEKKACNYMNTFHIVPCQILWLTSFATQDNEYCFILHGNLTL